MGSPWNPMDFLMILSCLMKYMMIRGFPGFHYTLKVAKMNPVISQTFAFKQCDVPGIIRPLG